ncbi:FecR domain-containing protein [Kerstersia similis]|uniref:FecR domain-containing protein n=1 Tax=Kerstersia similis TaxID=206505 RepID=UPI0039F05706
MSVMRGSSAATSAEGIDARVLGEAADWLVRMQEGSLDEGEQRRFDEWCQRSGQHVEAWRRAQSVLGTFCQVPEGLGRCLLPELAGNAGRNWEGRRRALRGLGVFALAAPAIWLLLRQMPAHLDWSAHYRSAVGQMREVYLPDGTLVVLNTATAVALDFSATARRVRLLAGEILISTQPDNEPQPRPFFVETAQGTAQALGTRYSVRQYGDATSVAVFDGRVLVRRKGDERALALLEPGQGLWFADEGTPQSFEARDTSLMWREGMLMARDMPLGELLQELGRYRHGVLNVSPAARDLRVSGAFPLADTDGSLVLLAETLPIQVRRRTRYWVTVMRADEAS